MTIHARKLPTFALYAAYADEFGVTVFGACRDEAVNNLADEIRQREGAGECGRHIPPNAAEGGATRYERK